MGTALNISSAGMNKVKNCKLVWEWIDIQTAMIPAENRMARNPVRKRYPFLRGG